MSTKQLIASIRDGKKLDADEIFQREMTERALKRLEQFKQDTARVLFSKDKK